MRSIRFLAIALPALLTAACLHASPEVKPPQLFAPGEVLTDDRPATLQGQGVTRVRPVTMNLEIFDETRARKPTEMNFFPNVNITVDWNMVEHVDQPSGSVWSGTVAGAPAGHAVMAISGKNVTATVTRGDGWIYEIRTTPNGGLWVREIDQQKFPQEREPVAPGRK